MPTNELLHVKPSDTSIQTAPKVDPVSLRELNSYQPAIPYYPPASMHLAGQPVPRRVTESSSTRARSLKTGSTSSF